MAARMAALGFVVPRTPEERRQLQHRITTRLLARFTALRDAAADPVEYWERSADIARCMAQLARLNKSASVAETAEKDG